MEKETSHWIVFAIIIVICLATDLFIFNRKAHIISLKESLIWSGIWISAAILYGISVYHFEGTEQGNQWFTAYVIEKSLSVDNLFVIYLIFQYFATPAQYQHRILFWGILGAIVFRGIFIFLGATVVAMFHPILYVFGVILVWSAVKIMLAKDEETQIKENVIVRFFKRHFPVQPSYVGTKFFTRKKIAQCQKFHYKTYATLSFIVLLMIETTDIIFAVDSIPAAFGITTNVYVLYTSNIFAVLGLRALYFVLENAVDKLWLLKFGIAIVLAFIGLKMCFDWLVEVPTNVSLIFVLGIIFLSGFASLALPKPNFNDD